MVDKKTAAEMVGTVDYRDVGEADHPIIPEEREMAIEIGYEIAKRNGIDLAVLVAKQEASENP